MLQRKVAMIKLFLRNLTIAKNIHRNIKVCSIQKGKIHIWYLSTIAVMKRSKQRYRKKYQSIKGDTEWTKC
jgi:hypothetical protein